MAIEFALDGKTVFENRRRRRDEVVHLYKRISDERVDELPLICRACDLPEIGKEVRYRAHKTSTGKAWCCHIRPEDLAPNEKLHGLVIHEPLQQKPDRLSDDGSLGFAKCVHNGGGLIIHEPLAQPADGKWYYMPGNHLVWHVWPRQISQDDRDAIVILESQEEEQGDPLTIQFQGQQYGVFPLLWFVEFDPNSPPRPREIRVVYSLRRAQLQESSAPIVEELVKRGLVDTTQAEKIVADASEMRLAIHRAFQAAYAYSVSIHGAEDADEEAPAADIDTLVERAVKKTRRQPRQRQARIEARPAAKEIKTQTVLAFVADKHFTTIISREAVGRNLCQAGYTNAAKICAASEEKLRSVLGSQARTDAVRTAAQQLIDREAKEANQPTQASVANLAI